MCIYICMCVYVYFYIYISRCLKTYVVDKLVGTGNSETTGELVWLETLWMETCSSLHVALNIKCAEIDVVQLAHPFVQIPFLVLGVDPKGPQRSQGIHRARGWIPHVLNKCPWQVSSCCNRSSPTTNHTFGPSSTQIRKVASYGKCWNTFWLHFIIIQVSEIGFCAFAMGHGFISHSTGSRTLGLTTSHSITPSFFGHEGNIC